MPIGIYSFDLNVGRGISKITREFSSSTDPLIAALGTKLNTLN